MTPNSAHATLQPDQLSRAPAEPRWLVHSRLLWNRRRMLVRVTAISLLIGLGISFSIPKQYKSTTSIMPPDEHSSSAMMLAALAGHLGGLGGLGGLADGLPSGHTNSSLFIFLLRSSAVSSDLIDRFNLQHVYHNRYRIDTAKHLAHRTTITEDKKSGAITIEVLDTDRERARDLAQGYLDELNQLVMRTNTSAAHRERVFIEQRLHSVQADLEDAELKLSQFSSNNTAIDIKEQTRATVDAGAKVQAELIVEQSGLESLRQIYGDGNMRVRESEARIASLQAQLARMTGSSSSTSGEQLRNTALNSGDSNEKAEMYPPLRQLPRLGVPYADLSRRVRVQEAVFELLTQQYETSRIEEAKDVAAVNVIDPPGLPEKKSFPPRLLLTLFLTFLSFACASSLILVRHYWSAAAKDDPRKEFFGEVVAVLRHRIHTILPFRGGAPSEGI
jgi:uncharacterized protein involved in exopolysaccharide biosynthesis